MSAARQGSLTRRLILSGLPLLMLAVQPLGAQSVRLDSLLDHLAGTWVMRGTLAGKPVVHDVTAKWVLNHEYLELTEVSREKLPGGAPQYEAILYFVRDTLTRDIIVLWLDNTSPSTFAPLGRGAATGDSIPFVWTLSPTDKIHNVFVYRRATDTWEERIDNEDAKGRHVFGRVTLSSH